MPRRRPKSAAPDTLTITSPAPATDKTVGDYIVEQLQAGVDPTNAALAAGVTGAEYREWMREGSLVMGRLQAGEDWTKDFTRHEQDLALWARDARLAHGRHVARLIVVSEQIARGGATATKTTTRVDAQGNVVETRTTSESSAPDGQMVRWKLESLAPDQYGRSSKVDVTIHDDTDTEAVGSLLEQRMRAVLNRLTSDVSDDDDDEPGA